MLVAISSTNNTLEEVYIKNGGESTYYGAYEDKGTRYGDLYAQGDTRVQTLVNGLSGSKVIPVADANAAADQPIDGAMAAQYSGYAFTDVRKIDGKEFKGDLKLNAILTEDVVDKYLKSDPTGAEFDYVLGSGADTFDLALSSANLAFKGTATQKDFALIDISGGDGKDAISTAIYQPKAVVPNDSTANYGVWDEDSTADGTELAVANETTPWYVNSKAANLTIDAGAGDDTVNTFGSGDWKVTLGAGNDTYYADNTGKKAVWVFNTTDQKNTGVVAARKLDALQSDGSDDHVGNAVSMLAGLYGLKLRVAYKDVSESANAVPDTGSGSGIYFSDAILVPTQDGDGRFKVSDLNINQAIKTAIDTDPVLSKLLVAREGVDNTLVVTARSDGAHVDVKDLQIEFAIPTVVKDAAAWINAIGWAANTTEQALSDGRIASLKALIGDSGTQVVSDLNAFGDKAASTDYSGWYTPNKVGTAAAKSDYLSAFGNDGAAHVAGTNSEHVADNTIDVTKDSNAGDRDVIVLSTGADSNDTIVWEGTDNGRVTVVNFDTAAAAATGQAVYTLNFADTNPFGAGLSATTGTLTIGLPGLGDFVLTLKPNTATTDELRDTLQSAIDAKVGGGVWTVAATTGSGNVVTVTQVTTAPVPGIGNPSVTGDNASGSFATAITGLAPSHTAPIFKLGNDTLDFSYYDAKWIGAAKLDANDEVDDTWDTAGGDGTDITVASTLVNGDKYITLTRRADATSTEYKIELWTVVGPDAVTASADAYAAAAIGGRDGKPDLIGYVDLGKEIEHSATGADIFDQIVI